MDPSCQEQILYADDLFDRLPDEIVLSIFNKLHDARSLCLSMAVCKRFQSIAPQINEIVLHIPRKKAGVEDSDQETQKGFFKNFVTNTLIKPVHFISQLINPKSKNDESSDVDLDSFHIPNDALKSFDEIRKLHLRIPCYGNQKLGSRKAKNSQNSTFLKWKAEFGRELQSCVVIGAKSVSEMGEIEEKLPASSRAEVDLKLRIVWTISCLIAASARHYLIRDTVKNQKMIENVVVSDDNEQGWLCMNKEQIEEVRGFEGKEDDLEFLRTKIPALRMKMWYLERLELPDSGKLMEGATLVVIRPAGVEDVKAEMMGSAFGEGSELKFLEEAVRKLMVAKKCYTLEMNSF